MGGPITPAGAVRLSSARPDYLLWFRKDAGSDPRCDAVQAFLMSSVLQDAHYQTITVFAEEFG